MTDIAGIIVCVLVLFVLLLANEIVTLMVLTAAVVYGALKLMEIAPK